MCNSVISSAFFHFIFWRIISLSAFISAQPLSLTGPHWRFRVPHKTLEQGVNRTNCWTLMDQDRPRWTLDFPYFEGRPALFPRKSSLRTRERWIPLRHDPPPLSFSIHWHQRLRPWEMLRPRLIIPVCSDCILDTASQNNLGSGTAPQFTRSANSPYR